MPIIYDKTEPLLFTSAFALLAKVSADARLGLHVAAAYEVLEKKHQLLTPADLE